MKRMFKFCAVCFIMIMLPACGKDGNAADEGIWFVESEPLNVPESTGANAHAAKQDEKDGAEDNALNQDAGMENNRSEQENKDAGEDAVKNDTAGSKLTGEAVAGTGAADPYTGEYNDYDTDEPNLEILKNADETYQIFIGVFRLASFDDAVGMLTETGLAFTATAPDLSEVTGVISLEGDIATVTFDPGWEGFEGIYSYKYYKTSDTPDFNM